jgi:hypothetical protein
MLRSHALLSGWVLDEPVLPPGVLFFHSTALSDSGKVYGTAYALGDGDSLDLYVAACENGADAS